jgi:hypothetical protein
MRQRWHSPRTLLPGYPSGVVLEIEQVLRLLGQRSHPCVEVRALEVGHGLKALLPYGVLLILNREKRDRQCCSSGEAVLAQGGESHVHHQLNAGVGLAVDDGPRPRLRGVEEYRHADVALVDAMDRGQSAMVDWSVPVIAKMDDCVVYHSQEPQAMLACGTQPPIIGEVEVGVIVQLHVKCRHKNVTNPIIKSLKSKYRNLYKANNSK